MVLSNTKDSTTIQSFKNWKASFDDSDVFYLNVFKHFVLGHFSKEFGAFNLGMIYRFNNFVQNKLKVSMKKYRKHA